MNNQKKNNNMEIEVFKNKLHLGALSFSDDNIPFVLSDSPREEELNNLIRESSAGIKITQSHPEKDGCTIFEKELSPKDEDFPLAFTQWLKQKEYFILIRNKEIEKNILSFTESLDDENPIKNSILKTLPEMNYLDKHYIWLKIQEKME